VSQTAAILVRSWSSGHGAVRALRALGVHAHLAGERSLLDSRVAVDLRLWLTVLIDPSDDVAWIGVLKHPSLGISDRGLLLLRRAGGFASLLVPEFDFSVLDATDRARLEGAIAHVRDARGRIGRESTADVLERLCTALAIRPRIAASPEGDGGLGIAQLDVLLERVRNVESATVDPFAVLASLAREDSGEDLPVVRLHHDPRVVIVTTVHSAKGLEFDHVALLGIPPARIGPAKSAVDTLTLQRVDGRQLLGVRLDPRGGLADEWDPMATVARAISQERAREESLRLFYVGFTRARRSVMFGLPAANERGVDSQLARVRSVFLDEARFGAAVKVIAGERVGDTAARVRLPTLRRREFEARWAASEVRAVQHPTDSLDTRSARHELVARFRERAHVVLGSPTSPGIPWIDAFESVSDTVWGELIHGWFATWGFRGEPSVHEADSYLTGRWRTDDRELSGWLVELGLAVRDRIPDFRQLIEGRRLRFELPLVSVDDGRILTGRTDLLIDVGDRELVVIDVKAGTRVAVPDEIPGDTQYAPQLAAYQRMLTAAGYRVRETGLLFVQGPSWVRVAGDWLA
jgi:ATP-dependent exoDNAse (exonuclease V) beta subunit